MLKSELRKIYLQKNISLSIADVASSSKAIAKHFFEDTDLTNIKTLNAFIRIGKFNEIDTSAIYYKLWRDFPAIRTFAPRTNFVTDEIESVIFNAETKLLENKWGIYEPADGENIDATSLDLVIVPLLCFDRRGFRVGYGKGFYDKFLSRCRADCLKIGLSFFSPVDEIADISEHDVRLDFCVTPEKTFATEISE